MKNKSIVNTFIIFFIVFNLVSCAPIEQTSVEYGFFSGIGHGIVFPFALIGKLFGADIGLFADNNTGFTYIIGFIIGLGLLGGGGGAAAKR